MFSIRPKNYKEVVCLKQCLQLQRQVPDLEDAQMEEIFRFVLEDGNVVAVTPGNVSLRKGSGEIVKSFSVAEPVGVRTYDSILLTAAIFRVSYPYVSSGGSYGDSGSSGNNNNNNNNNNNG